MYTVKHPNQFFNGVRCGITFTNGVGHTPELTDVQRFHFERWEITIEGGDTPAKGKKGKAEIKPEDSVPPTE